MAGESPLGPYLKGARERRCLSLRDVEIAAGVSNAYLSQIESGRIRQPSPAILSKLSAFYNVSYADVMKLAGYPVPDQAHRTIDPNGLAARLGPVTKDEEAELLKYLEFLRMKRRRGGGGR